MVRMWQSDGFPRRNKIGDHADVTLVIFAKSHACSVTWVRRKSLKVIKPITQRAHFYDFLWVYLS